MTKNLPSITSSSDTPLATVNGGQRIATRMAENLLGMARSQERALAAKRRYRIGDYEFREADHAQIQHWAWMLGMEPEKVVEGLASSQKKRSYSNKINADFQVADGAIVSIVWDFDLLPLSDWAWGWGLQIRCLGILNAPSGTLPPLPACLHDLLCDDNRLTDLDLTPVPDLQVLICGDNQLTMLDLAPVLGLQKLNCWGNQLTKLDLTPVPGLKELRCDCNYLTDLDLTPVPGLQVLDCGVNELTALDLTSVPGLHELNCSANPLTELDLALVPNLQKLNCWENELTELNLAPVLGLQELDCANNYLTKLDLASVLGLQELRCTGNYLTELDLSKRPPNALLARGWIQVQAVVGAAGCQRWGSREEMSACLVVGRRVITSRK